MNKKCDCCQNMTNSFSILGVLSQDFIPNRPAARICDDCLDTCPCGEKGYWNNGKITCPHGDVFTVDYVWDVPTYRTKNKIAKLLFNKI